MQFIRHRLAAVAYNRQQPHHSELAGGCLNRSGRPIEIVSARLVVLSGGKKAAVVRGTPGLSMPA